MNEEPSLHVTWISYSYLVLQMALPETCPESEK